MKMGRWVLAAAVCASALTIALPSHAGWSCQGKAKNIAIGQSGTVVMSLFRTDGTPIWEAKYLCSVRVQENTLDPQVCRSIYALLMTSAALNRTVTFWFDYSNTTSPACTPARFPSWTWLTAGDAGWYYGPQLDDGP